MKSNKFLALIAIILISIGPMTDIYIVLPAFNNIVGAFPNASETLITLIMTISSLSAIPTSLIVGKIVGDGKLNKKTALLIGFLLFTIGGASGGLFVNVYWIIFAMAVKGIGNGFALALIVTVTADYFFGKERAAVFGIYNAMGFAIANGIFIVAGRVALINWRYVFLLYIACGLIVVVYHALVLKKNPPKTQEALAEEEAERKEMEAALAADANRKPSSGRIIWILVIITFITQLLCNSFYVTLPVFVESVINGDYALFMAISTAAIVVCSFAFGIVYPRTKKFTAILFFVLIGAGYLIMAFSHTFQMALVALIIWGAGYGLTVPYLYQEASLLPRKSITLAGAIVNSVMFSAFYVSDHLPPFVASIFNNGSVRFLYVLIAAFLGICAVIFTIYFNVSKKDRMI